MFYYEVAKVEIKKKSENMVNEKWKES